MGNHPHKTRNSMQHRVKRNDSESQPRNQLCSTTRARRLGRRRRPTLESLEQRALLAALLVTDNADIGPGTFRAAIEQANEDSRIRTIRFADNLAPIQTESSIEYTGSQSLRVLGRGATIEPVDSQLAEPAAEFDLFISSGAADLLLRDLTFQGSNLNGIFIPIPGDASGTVDVELDRVSLVDNALSGLLIDDQISDSPASINFSMTRTNIIGNGFKPGFDDFDGVRVNEGGDGSILSSIRFSTVEGNAGDGVEYDERDAGDVVLRASHSSFNYNGTQPQLPSDLEDGLDIDEAGEGSIHARLIRVEASGNEDEGIDFDESGTGDLIAHLLHVRANGNLDENIKLSEDADAEPPDPDDFDLDDAAQLQEFQDALDSVNQAASGDLIAHLVLVQANDSRDGDGIRFEEFGLGNLIANLLLVETDNNDDEGIQVSEGSELYDAPEVNLPEQNEGNLIMRLIGSRVTNNGDKGVQVEQFGVGDDIGRLRIRATLFEGNEDDDVDAEGVTVLGGP
jgi:hypothetical protein